MAGERPSKIRKLNHDAESGEPCANGHASVEADALLTSQESTNDGAGKAPTVLDGAPGMKDAPSKDPTSSTTELEQQGLSKNKLKKLRKRAEWEAKRPAWKEKMKEKRLAKRQRKRAEREQQQVADIEPPKWAKAVQLPVSIVFDCDFENYMTEKENVSLGNQIVRAYSDRRKSLFRSHLVLCSFGGQLKDDFERRRPGYRNWKGVQILDCDFVEAPLQAKEYMCSTQGGELEGSFAKYACLDDEAREKLKVDAEVVYLSSEADEDLTELKPYSTYIIGGLVDKNREKGLCYKRATERGMRTARLPIGVYMNISGRKVLATNHVNEIMLKWLECGDWGQAFSTAIPKRRGGKLKGIATAEAGEDDEDANFEELAEADIGKELKEDERPDECVTTAGEDATEDDEDVTIIT